MKRTLGWFVVVLVINGGVAVWTGIAGPRSFETLGDDRLTQVRGGVCYDQTAPDCDGVPVTCDGGTDLNPYPAGNCTQQDDGTWNCNRSGKDLYQNNTHQETWPKCVVGSTWAATNDPQDFACYKTWTCPTKCVNIIYKGGAIWVCRDGANSTAAGIHQATLCTAFFCQE